MTNKRNVWVFIEQEAGEIATVSLELLSKARELAERLKGRVCALLFGHDVADLAEPVIHHGADLVYLADHPELGMYRTLPYARVAIDLVQERRPYIFFLGMDRRCIVLVVISIWSRKLNLSSYRKVLVILFALFA